jgi:hypothetical protein
MTIGWLEWRGRRYRIAPLVFCVVCVCFFCNFDTALAQVPASPGAGATNEPPLVPPVVRQLPDGVGTLSIGDWLLYPTLNFHTFYDTNIYSSPTSPISTAGVNFNPTLLAQYDSGIYATSLYGNISSNVYPFISSANDTFDRQAGFVEKYEAMRDLIFTVQGDYHHLTEASVYTQALPSTVVSPASPQLPGAAGFVAPQQIFVNPNDTYTATGSVYKEFNRAFLTASSTFLSTQYANQQLATNYSLAAYNIRGGAWLTPLFYAYANGSESFVSPAVGPAANFSQVMGGIGSAKIGHLVSGSIYYGYQNTDVANGGGTAGGSIYGAKILYVPTSVWNVTVSVDRIVNISNITGILPIGTPGSLPGLPLAGAPVGLNQSIQVTAPALRSDYQFSAQTSVFGVIGYTAVDYLNSSLFENFWTASVGIRHTLSSHLTLTFDYAYTAAVSNIPVTSFNRNYTALGASYKF